ncbi:MAG: hypothetical protein CL526_08115 [Aequorivita sp.]|nr:hypothetical protein [Aequorivita sp.]|tara:strand:- start:8840 stop:10696 length:1857 start_codon:yes stop_codon:yes gene_type:complete
MKERWCCIIFILSCFWSFSQTFEIESIKDKIEGNIDTDPHLSKKYMFQLLEHTSQLHDTVVGKTYSHIGIQYNKLAQLDSSEYFMKKALSFTKNYPKVHGDLYLNLAINYRIGSRYKKALQAGETAIELFNKANNKRGIGRAYGEMASVYNYMKDSEKALILLKKAIPILSEYGTESELCVVKQKLANLYYNNGDYAFARDIYEEILNTFAKKKGANYYSTLLTYADCLVRLEENYEAAENALREAVKGFRELSNKEYKWLALSNLAEVYNTQGKVAEAREAFATAHQGLLEIKSSRFMETSVQYLQFLNAQNDFNTALNVIKQLKTTLAELQLKVNAETEIAFLKQAVKTYTQLGMVENSLASFQRMDFLKDSLHNAVNTAKIFEMQESYQNEIQLEKNRVLQENNLLLAENNSKKDKILLLTVLSFILLLLIGFLLFQAHKNKYKLQQELVSSLENAKKTLEEKNELAIQLRQEREIALANKERELIDVATDISEVQKKAMELIENRENPESSQVLAEKLTYLLSRRNYWKYFKGKFVDVHPVFAKQLAEMFPNLSESDIAFSCMLKLQLSNEEIAALMGISAEKVTTMTNALRRKMGLGDDIVRFENIIHNLETH